MRLDTESKAAFDQRGRAGLQFLGSLQYYSSGALLEQAQRDFDAEPGSTELAAEYGQPGDEATWHERVERAKSIARQVPAYRFNRFYQRYVAEENWVRGLTAVERRRAELAHMAAPTDVEPNERLILNPDIEIPPYFEGVEWHLPAGRARRLRPFRPDVFPGDSALRIQPRRIRGGRPERRHPSATGRSAVAVPAFADSPHLRCGQRGGAGSMSIFRSP